MATIEERSLKHYPINCNCFEYSKRLGYIQGAKEQHKIDIDQSLIFIKSAFPNSPLVLQAYLEFMNN